MVLERSDVPLKSSYAKYQDDQAIFVAYLKFFSKTETQSLLHPYPHSVLAVQRWSSRGQYFLFKVSGPSKNMRY